MAVASRWSRFSRRRPLLPPTSSIVIRCPASLRTASEAAALAADKSLSEWVRSLMEAATGVSAVDMPQGFAAMKEGRARRIQSRGGKAKAAKRKKKP